MNVLLIILGILLVVSAIAAISMKNIASAIITAGVVSLIGSLLFLLAGAPDVAMTEAAIGAALTTVIFLFAWSRIRDFDSKKNDTHEQEEDPS